MSRNRLLAGVPCGTYCTVSFNDAECDNDPEAAVTVKEYPCEFSFALLPHPFNPTARAAPRSASTASLFHCRAALRSLPAKGSRMRLSAKGSEPPPNGRAGCASAALPGNCTRRVTVVVPEPAVTVAGEKVAVAASNRPPE